MKLVLLGVVLGCAGNLGCASSPEPGRAATPSTVFISDYGANAILAYDGATGAFREVFAAGSEQRVDRPAGVRLGPDGALYSAGFGRGEVVRYDGATGAMMDVFYRDTTLLEEPVALAFHGDELVVLGNDTANAVVLDATGRVRTELGDPRMRGAHDFVLDGDRMFVGTDVSADLGAVIQEWDLPTGRFVRALGGRVELTSATGVAIGNGVLYACDYALGRVARFDLETGESLGVLAEGGPLTGATSLAIDPDGETLNVLATGGLVRIDADSGETLGVVVSRDARWRTPRGFTIAAVRSP